MCKIWLTSDLHFNHDKEFIYKPRGFNTIQEMNESIVDRFNSKVSNDDTVYILGDIMLGGNDLSGLNYLERLNGNIHIIIGNHDTQSRINQYTNLANVKSVQYATLIKYGKHSFYLSHYPTITSNMESKRNLINLFGHTHQTDNFYENNYYMYHVGVDSHNCYPVSLDDIIYECRIKRIEENV